MGVQEIVVFTTAIIGGELLTTRMLGREPVFEGSYVLLTAVALTANLIVYGIWLTFIYPFFFSPLRHIPSPKGGNLILGHAIPGRFTFPRGERAREWMEEIPNEGLLQIRDLFNDRVIIPTSPATLKTILNDNVYDYSKIPKVVQILRTILGDGLILSEGENHKFQRKHLQPSFHTKVIKDLCPVFWTKACELASSMREASQETETEFGVWCTRVTLDIIGIAGFGRDFNTLRDPNDPFVADYNQVLEPSAEKGIFFLLNLLVPNYIVMKLLTPFWQIPRELGRISTVLYNFGFELSRKRRAELNSPKITETEYARRNDILSHLIKSNDFSDHSLAHQVLTMMAAGHETTSSTLSWCIFLLAQHPDIQIQLRSEIRSSLPSPDLIATQSITSSLLDSLPLLNGVCQETLRLYPTVPITSRQTITPTQLGNYTLPTGTLIFIIPWAINKLTSFWGPDSLAFNPSRWIDLDGTEKSHGTPNNHGGATSNYANLTFLHGPRSCIGQAFARSELKCLLAAVVGRYEFELTRDVETYFPAGLVTTKPAKGMWVRVREVEGW